jgi:hypothetical protein
MINFPMHRIKRLLLAATLLLGASAQAGDFKLITAAESEAEQKSLKQLILVPKAITPGATSIEVLEPDLNLELASPLLIRVRFTTHGKASLVPDSLRVYYGVFGIDITERLMLRARFDNNTLIVERADVPVGKHRLLLRIRDSEERSTEKLLTLNVARHSGEPSKGAP